jgi:hypothetical protein
MYGEAPQSEKMVLKHFDEALCAKSSYDNLIHRKVVRVTMSAPLIVFPGHEDTSADEKQRLLRAAVACAAASLLSIKQLLAEGATLDWGSVVDIKPLLGLMYKILTGQDWW